MIENKDITLLIHGPISLYTIFNLYRYKAEHPMIFVIPKIEHDAQQTKLLRELHMLANTSDNVNVLTYTPNVPPEYDNRQNRYLHFFSVKMGLQTCKTKYVIKIRSDEFYSDLDYLVDVMNKYNHKIITNDVYFRKEKYLPMHPSDHLVASKTKILQEVFTLAESYCIDRSKLTAHPLYSYALKNTKLDFISAEQILGMSSLQVLAFTDTKNFDIAEMMKNSFEIVSSDKLGWFRVKSNSTGNKEYFDTSYFSKDDDVRDIRDYQL